MLDLGAQLINCLPPHGMWRGQKQVYGWHGHLSFGVGST
jgi:hypothetical protein